MNITTPPPASPIQNPQKVQLNIASITNLSATRYPLMATFGSETMKAMEMAAEWWRIRTNDPRVKIRGMTIPGPRAGKNREQE
jgi:hypothetical protein